MFKRYTNWLPLAHPHLGTWPTTQACTLSGNWTGDLLVHRLALNSRSHTRPDSCWALCEPWDYSLCSFQVDLPWPRACDVLLSRLQFLVTQWMGDVHNVLSSSALLSSGMLIFKAYFMESIPLLFGLPLFLLPSTFPSIIVFLKEPCLLTMCAKQENFSSVISASSNVSGLVCSRTHLFIFLVVQGVCRTLPKNHILNGSILFLLAFSTVSLFICS